MKKLFTLFMLFGLIVFVTGLKAQTGLDCVSAQVIPWLPYSQTSLNTASTGNVYSSASACASNYLNGNDYVFVFTPTANMNVKISLSNTGNAVGVFVSDSCFDNPNAACIASATSLIGNPEIVNVALTVGHPYYILVSTNAVFGVNQTTPFDISIVELIQIDAEVTAITQPVSNCLIGTQEIIAVIQNNGIDSLYNFNVNYTITGVNSASEVVTDTILPGANLAYHFTNTSNFVATGTFLIKAYTSISADADHSNDTAVASVTNFANVTTFPYFQDFESGNDTWTPTGSNSSWALGTPACLNINSAASGINSWKTNLTGNYNAAEVSYVESPCFDFSLLLNPNISFKIWYETPTTAFGTLEYSSDNGLSWQTIGASTDPNWYNLPTGWSGTSGQWITVKHSLSSLAGLPSIKFRIHLNSAAGNINEGIAFDDISIYDNPAKDLALVSIDNPMSSCGLSSNENVTVKVVNIGTMAQSGFNLRYTVNGGPLVNETIAGILNAGDTLVFTFSVQADFSAIANYEIKAQVVLTGDTTFSNDTLSKQIFNSPVISAFPYIQDFETGTSYWVAGGTNSSWALGTPADSVINTAASGVKAWKTNLNDDYNAGENSWVESPCFDFSGLIKPIIDFHVWYETTLIGSATLQSSTDNGATWTTIGATGEPNNWYNGILGGWSGNAGQWLFAKHLLNNLGGQPSVKLRVAFNGGIIGGTSEGFAFDDIHIYDTPANDLGVIEISTPVSDCGLGNETVIVKIVNYGTAMQNNFAVKYSKNGGTSYSTETVAAALLPEDTLSYQFSALANLSVPTLYDFIATTSLTSDGDHSNDTTHKQVVSYPLVNTFPYIQNFDGAISFWEAGGTSSSWTLGTPAKPIINTAASGTKSWVTSLTGNHNANENSFVTSPCMDFSSLQNPFIEMSIWYETSILGSADLQVSTDNGLSWQNIGATGDPNNWYNNLLGGWSGSSAGWLTAKHKLDNLGGAPNVKLRVHLNGGFFLSSEGLAFDDIHIYECIPPVASFSSVAINSTVNCTNTSTNATSYLWNFGDGATSTSASPSHTYAASGIYNVTLYASNNCDIDSLTLTVQISSGIDDFSTSNVVSIFPNPNTGIFTIIANNSDASELEISVYDIAGKCQFADSFHKSAGDYLKTLNLTNLAKGLYTIKVKDNNSNTIGRIIIQ